MGVLAFAMATLAFGATAAAQQGSFPKAPSLQVETWVKGPKTALKGGPDRIFMIEMWATWCGPCIDAMPHLAELQRKHADRLHVVALTEEEARIVKPFVAKTDMPFSVAVDKNGVTTAAYRDAFDFRGIPTTFIVSQGQVLWHGHPNEVDMVLPFILAGTWTPDSLAQFQQLRLDMQAFTRQLSEGKKLEGTLAAQGEAILKAGAPYPSMLNEVAWYLLTEVDEARRPGDLTFRMAKAANDGAKGQNAAIMDTYALALFQAGRVDEAITLQTKALSMCRAAGQRCDSFEKTLRRYQSAKP